MSEVRLDFQGPFSFVESSSSIFKAPCASTGGVYLWTIRQRDDDTHLIHYVGETNSLADRHYDHLNHILSLNYGIFHPEKAQEGFCELVWPGLWGRRMPDDPSKQRLIGRFFTTGNTY